MIRRRPTAAQIKEQKRNAFLDELAAEPHNAHDEWKRLSNMEKIAVVERMSKRYGEDFKKSFLRYAENPVESVFAVFGSNDEHEPQWFQARGYQLWQTTQGATPTMTGEYWVHPSGNIIMQLRDRKNGTTPVKDSKPVEIVEPPTDGCTDLAQVVSAILRDELATENSVMKDLEAQKGRLEKSNKTTADYRDQYDDYIQSMEAMKTRLEETIGDLETFRDQLAEMKCPPVSELDAGLQELSELQIWVDIESSPMMLQFLQPIKMPDYK